MARALGNLIGNCVATVVIAAWERDLNIGLARQVLDGQVASILLRILRAPSLQRRKAKRRRCLIGASVVVVVVMMVVMVMVVTMPPPPPVVMVMMVVVVVILRKLDGHLLHRALVVRLQDIDRVRDRIEQFGVGTCRLQPVGRVERGGL